MLKPLLKKAIPLLAMIPLLGACSPFQPKTKVIEYDEEVKLHDGSMIWVHIKRHYERSNGREISNWFQGYEKGWGAKEVEISWDTGFPNVGRKSVFFTSIQIFEKYQNNFYIVGGTPSDSRQTIGNSLNCKYIGTPILQRRCLVSLNDKGEFFASNISIINNFNQMNILYPYGIEGFSEIPTILENKKLNWNEKLMYQQKQIANYQRIGKPFLTGEK